MEKTKKNIERFLKPTLLEELIPFFGGEAYIKRVSGRIEKIKKYADPKKVNEMENTYSRNLILKICPIHTAITTTAFLVAGHYLFK